MDVTEPNAGSPVPNPAVVGVTITGSPPVDVARNVESQRRILGVDTIYHGISLAVACAMVLVLVTIIVVLLLTAWPALTSLGIGFLVGTTWNSTTNIFGALPFIVGTAITTFLALLLAVPISTAIALLLSEYAPQSLAAILGVVIDVAAGVPTIVFGAWALLALVPWLRDTVDPVLYNIFGWLPIFAMPQTGYLSGYGMLSAGLVLAAMIAPTIITVTRSSLLATPPELREASMAVGATRWETATRVVLRQARSGLLGGVILACGRALGETIAVASIIGNAPALPNSLFDQGATLATELFSQVYGGNASPGTMTTAALYELALILLASSALTSLSSRVLTRGTLMASGGGR